MIEALIRPTAALTNAFILGSAGAQVSHENITVTLPIFIAAMVASIGFTWSVALWNQKRDKRIDDQSRKIAALETALEKIRKKQG